MYKETNFKWMSLLIYELSYVYYILICTAPLHSWFIFNGKNLVGS